MSNNIWGYQGLQTPLENLTQGNYNVADYTNMRREFNARLQALENAGGFTPTNVSIQGFCNIVPGTNGFGNFSATGSTILGGTLNVASTATFQGGVTVAGALSVSSVNISSLTVDSITSTGNITSTAGQFIGNGAGLTGIIATPPAPTVTTYTSSPGVVVLNLTAMDNYIRNSYNAGLSMTFTGRVIGQKITIIRDVINLSFGQSFFINSTTYPGSLPYRLFTLDGTVTNFVIGINNTAPIAYTYAGQQKIRNTFIVLESTVPATYSFDLVEIS
jgi:hypothetical protein